MMHEPRLGIQRINHPKKLQPNFSNEALRQPKAVADEGTCSKKALLARFEVWDHFSKFDPFAKKKQNNSQESQKKRNSVKKDDHVSVRNESARRSSTDSKQAQLPEIKTQKMAMPFKSFRFSFANKNKGEPVALIVSPTSISPQTNKKPINIVAKQAV